MTPEEHARAAIDILSWVTPVQYKILLDRISAAIRTHAQEMVQAERDRVTGQPEVGDE